MENTRHIPRPVAVSATRRVVGTSSARPTWFDASGSRGGAGRYAAQLTPGCGVRPRCGRVLETLRHRVNRVGQLDNTLPYWATPMLATEQRATVTVTATPNAQNTPPLGTSQRGDDWSATRTSRKHPESHHWPLHLVITVYFDPLCTSTCVRPRD